jgi:hypothetical protein
MAELFDLQEEAQKRKKEGMEEAARNRKRLLEVARDCAEEMSCYGECTSDHVAGAMERSGYRYESLGNAAGSIFRGKEWVFTGEWVASKRPSSHGRMIRVWRYEGEVI